MNGWLNINKGSGYSSTSLLNKIKKQYKLKKIGHLGTLDPLATGVLPIAIGEATKTINFISEKIKSYEFIIKWGEETDTYDEEGTILRTSKKRPIEEDIYEVISKFFLGEISQTPPNYSAVKVNGERAYKLARKNIKFNLIEKNITIFSFKILESIDQNHTKFYLKCSSGSYVRSLVQDLSLKLGTVGHAKTIKRIEDCVFKIEDSIDAIDLLKLKKQDFQKKIKPVCFVLKNFLEYDVEKKYAENLKSGNIIYLDFLKEEKTKEKEYILIKCEGKLVSIANLQKGYIIPRRNFNN